MTAIETNVTNRAESTLSAPLGVGATTINVTDTSAFPAVPFYCVIDPNDDALAEVVLVDSAKTPTTLTLSAVGNRGQDGTSDVAHDPGAIIAIVPVAAHFTDLNDRVDVVASSIASHDHDGTGDVQIATSNLTGHTEAAHTALGLFNDTSHDAHDHSAAAASIASADLADHDKATHEALAIDHGSLSGTTDDDHPAYGHFFALVGASSGSVPAGTPTTVNLTTAAVAGYLAGGSIASGVITVDYSGVYLVAAKVSGESTTAASTGSTLTVQVNGVTEVTNGSEVYSAGPPATFEIVLGNSARWGTNLIDDGGGLLELTAGDEVSLVVTLTPGSGHNITAAYMFLERIG